MDGIIIIPALTVQFPQPTSVLFSQHKVPVWSNFFNSLRASRSREIRVLENGRKLEHMWIGHTEAVADLYYDVANCDKEPAFIEDHYFENLHAAAFVDIGDAWYPDKRTPYPHIGAGLELRSDVIVNRRNGFQLYLGAGKSLLGQGTTNYLIDRPIEFYGGFANIF